MPGGGFVFVIALLLFALFAIVIPLWVYSDAQRNSSHSALLWALVAFFGGLLGLLLYLLIGRNRTGGRGDRGGGRGGNDRWNDGFDDSDGPEVRR